MRNPVLHEKNLDRKKLFQNHILDINTLLENKKQALTRITLIH